MLGLSSLQSSKSCNLMYPLAMVVSIATLMTVYVTLSDSDALGLPVHSSRKLASYAYGDAEVEERVTEVNRDFVKLGMGSCLQQRFEHLYTFKAMSAQRPDAIYLLGDNVYLDMIPDKKGLEKGNYKRFNWKWENVQLYKNNPRAEYDLVLKHKDFIITDKRNNWYPTIISIWDDHDYGADNLDANNPFKNKTKDAFVYFMRKTNQKGRLDNQIEAILDDSDNPLGRGVYYHYDEKYKLKTTGETLFIRNIMLDVRWYRTEDDILGIQQWQWFENILKLSAMDKPDWIILGVGTTYYLQHPKLTKKLGGESWDKNSKNKFIELINKYNLKSKCIILSGDVHYSVIYNDKRDNLLPEFIVSSFTHSIDNLQKLAGVQSEHENDKNVQRIEDATVPGSVKESCCVSCIKSCKDESAWRGISNVDNYGMLKLYKNKYEFQLLDAQSKPHLRFGARIVNNGTKAQITELGFGKLTGTDTEPKQTKQTKQAKPVSKKALPGEKHKYI